MKKFLGLLVFIAISFTPSYADNTFKLQCKKFFDIDNIAIKSVLNSQVKYANRENFTKFISTYDKDYYNSDGMNLDTYSNLIKDVWNTYSNIKYGIKIKNIDVQNDTASVKLVETSTADISLSKNVNGVLKSQSNSIYYLKKLDGKWKVVSDCVEDETTSMLYGEAKNLNIKLSAPKEINPNIEYTASLEFETPKGMVSVASIAKDTIEYPQKQTQEVFRKMPDDNILERLFISNNERKNEYIIASIGLTKTNIDDLSIKLSLAGFGYKIIRVNVVPNKTEGADVKNQ